VRYEATPAWTLLRVPIHRHRIAAPCGRAMFGSSSEAAHAGHRESQAREELVRLVDVAVERCSGCRAWHHGVG
jgi:hypothetical protein